MRRLSALCLVSAMLGVFTTSVSAQPKDIVDTAVAAGTFKTLTQLLTAADLVTVMKGPGPYTVFAPTDDAFKKVPKETLDALAKDKAKLQTVLKYHVWPMRATAADIAQIKQMSTASGHSVTIKASGGKLMINDANVIAPDVGASNGVIHVIDTVLIPKL